MSELVAYKIGKKDMEEKLGDMGQSDRRAQEDLFGWRENDNNRFRNVGTATAWATTASTFWMNRR